MRICRFLSVLAVISAVFMPLAASGAPLSVCDMPLSVCDAPLSVCDMPLSVCGAPLSVCDMSLSVGDTAAFSVGDTAAFSVVDTAAFSETYTGYSVRIEGYAAGAEGREIVWRADADMLSGDYRELDRTQIDSNGYFTLSTSDIARVTPTYLLLDYYATGIFVEPRRCYRLEMQAFDYHLDERMNAFVVSNRLPELRYRLSDSAGNPDTADLNVYLGRYSYAYEKMLGENFERINLQRDTAPAGEFLRASERDYGAVNHPYFRQYKMYVEASLKHFAHIASRKELFDNYIDNRAVDADNPAQVAFLKDYFLAYFASNRILPFNQTLRIVQDKESEASVRIKNLSDSMGLDYALRNERLREWVLVYALSELWSDVRVDPVAVSELMQWLSQNAKFKENALSAARLLARRERDYKRAYFTGVRLRERSGAEISVDSLLEIARFHYFLFVRADYENCPSCAEELHTLRRIWEKADAEVKDAVRIFVVNCDYEYARYIHDARKNEYPWPYLHFNRNVEWIRRIDAARFPAFFLVDDKGNVLNAEFNAPSNNLQEVFKRMAKTRKKMREDSDL